MNIPYLHLKSILSQFIFSRPEDRLNYSGQTPALYMISTMLTPEEKQLNILWHNKRLRSFLDIFFPLFGHEVLNLGQLIYYVMVSNLVNYSIAGIWLNNNISGRIKRDHSLSFSQKKKLWIVWMIIIAY